MAGDSPGRHDKDTVTARVCDEMTRALARPLAPGLYLVSTPIGNLADITIRALAILSKADVIYAEDTRHSLRLLSHFAIPTRTRPYHEHNADRTRPAILQTLQQGGTIALISDAGTPLVSDPGYKLVRDVTDAGHAVFSIPGPSAVLAALSSSALPTDTFMFAGFLPPKPGPRRARIKALQHVPATLIFFEGPSRVAELITDLHVVLGDRPAVVARELTKLHEEIVRGPLQELEQRLIRNSPKGEYVVLIGPPVKQEIADQEILQELRPCLDDMSLRDAARHVAEKLDTAKARVYALGLKIKNET